jgi:hypothetical protein
MKRLCVVLSLIALFTVLALPAVARADDPAPAAEQSQPIADPSTDGWTWDESADPNASTDGWTWDEAAAPSASPDGWTWDEE